MKVLLINSNTFKQPWPVLPFGLCCVASTLENAGHKVKVLDLNFVKNIEEKIRATAHDFSPDVIGISIRNIDNSVGYNTLFLLEDVKNKVIEPCKKLKAPIIIGGPAVGINAEEILEYLDLNYAIRGDGEIAFVEFLKRLKTKDFSNCPGLTERKNGKIIQSNLPACVFNLDSLPFTKVYKWINLKPYKSFNTAIQIQTKRGCALNCSYCTYNSIEGRKFRLRSAKKIADEIEDIVKNTGIKQIHFTDSVFNIPIEHCKNVLKEIIKKDLNLELATLGLNPATVDHELVDLIKKAGFTSVDVGAESASPVCLKSLNKNFNLEQLEKTATLIRKTKIPVQWYFLLGCEVETEKTIKETFNFIDKFVYKWDLANIGIGCRVYKGSPIANNLNRERERVNNGLLFPFCLTPKNLSIEKLKYFVKKEALKRNNVFMYDEDETTPEFVLKISTAFLNFLRSKQPVWRLWILKTKIKNFFV
jgi:radical SAM superfamily enzyme YgiQ (UPF0313 family)